MSWNDARNATPSFDYKPEAWMEQSACIGHNPEMWFPDDRSNNTEETRLAKAICGSCPVATQCLDYALRTEPGFTRFGIFGGLTADARRRIAKENVA